MSSWGAHMFLGDPPENQDSLSGHLAQLTRTIQQATSLVSALTQYQGPPSGVRGLGIGPSQLPTTTIPNPCDPSQLTKSVQQLETLLNAFASTSRGQSLTGGPPLTTKAPAADKGAPLKPGTESSVNNEDFAPIGNNYKNALLRPKITGDDVQPQKKISLLRALNKIAQIRRRKPSEPYLCFKCGDAGHRASECRNPTKCFACDGLGHRSTQCRKLKSPIKTPAPSPPALSSKTTTHSFSTSTTAIMKHFSDTPVSMELDAAFRRSVVLHDSEGWGRDRVLTELRRSINYDWKVAEIPDEMMMVEGPSDWKDQVLHERFVNLDGVQLSVEPCLGADAGFRFKSVWIKVLGFPFKFWSKPDFEKLIEDFAILFEIDPMTRDRLSFKEAKLRIGVTDTSKIPEGIDITFKIGNGDMRWSRIWFVVETPVPEKVAVVKKRKIWVPRPNPPSDGPPSGSKSTEGSDNIGQSSTQNENVAQKETAMATDAEATPEEVDQLISESMAVEEEFLDEHDSFQEELPQIPLPLEPPQLEQDYMVPNPETAIVIVPERAEVAEETIVSPLQTLPPLTKHTRQSLRQKMNDPDKSVQEKAMQLAMQKNLEKTKDAGITPLLDHFPFDDYSDSQVFQLFTCYNLKLANTEQEGIECVKFLKTLTRRQFQSAVEEMEFKVLHGTKFLKKDKDKQHTLNKIISIVSSAISP